MRLSRAPRYDREALAPSWRKGAKGKGRRRHLLYKSYMGSLCKARACAALGSRYEAGRRGEGRPGRASTMGGGRRLRRARKQHTCTVGGPQGKKRGCYSLASAAARAWAVGLTAPTPASSPSRASTASWPSVVTLSSSPVMALILSPNICLEISGCVWMPEIVSGRTERLSRARRPRPGVRPWRCGVSMYSS